MHEKVHDKSSISPQELHLSTFYSYLCITSGVCANTDNYREGYNQPVISQQQQHFC